MKRTGWTANDGGKDVCYAGLGEKQGGVSVLFVGALQGRKETINVAWTCSAGMNWFGGGRIAFGIASYRDCIVPTLAEGWRENQCATWGADKLMRGQADGT